MSKNTYFFKHDFNAYNDDKILDMRMDLGIEGYGAFWFLVEYLANQKGYESEANYKRIGFGGGVCPSLLEKVINDYDLFVVVDNLFYSKTLKARMTRLDDVKEKRREAGSKGGKMKANAKQMLSKPLANAKQTSSKVVANASRGEERRREEKREEENIKDSTHLENALTAWNSISWTTDKTFRSSKTKASVSKKITARINTFGNGLIDDWAKALAPLKKASEKDNGWLKFEWAFNSDSNMEKLLEGNYSYLEPKMVRRRPPQNENEISEMYYAKVYNPMTNSFFDGQEFAEEGDKWTK
jgi:hypothetical protein|tara:strand:- start:137 stop:1030 length:894 start_codon:yes stop_codon:yes gene_type:complete